MKEDPKTVTPEDKPRQTWKVRPACGGQWLHVISLDELGDCDDGNEYELVSVWLTQKHGWQWRPTGKDTAFAPPFGTIRVCGACGCLVAGGPTACARCAEAGT